MNKIRTFKELLDIIQEAPGPGPAGLFGAPSSASPGATTPGAPKSAGVLSTIGKLANKFDPNVLAGKLKTINQQGALATISQGANALAQKQLTGFYMKLDLPTGWPKKGSNVMYVGIKNKALYGTVRDTSKVGDQLVVNIDFPSAGTGQPNRFATATHNINTDRPFNSLEKWYMQQYLGNRWVQDQEESGHAASRSGMASFKWDPSINMFKYDTDVTAPDTVYIPSNSFAAALHKVGSTLPSFEAPDGTRYRSGVVRGKTIAGRPPIEYLIIKPS